MWVSRSTHRTISNIVLLILLRVFWISMSEIWQSHGTWIGKPSVLREFDPELARPALCHVDTLRLKSLTLQLRAVGARATRGDRSGGGEYSLPWNRIRRVLRSEKLES
jgi:hypothetical protein